MLVRFDALERTQNITTIIWYIETITDKSILHISWWQASRRKNQMSREQTNLKSQDFLVNQT